MRETQFLDIKMRIILLGGLASSHLTSCTRANLGDAAPSPHHSCKVVVHRCKDNLDGHSCVILLSSVLQKGGWLYAEQVLLFLKTFGLVWFFGYFCTVQVSAEVAGATVQ